MLLKDSFTKTSKLYLEAVTHSERFPYMEESEEKDEMDSRVIRMHDKPNMEVQPSMGYKRLAGNERSQAAEWHMDAQANHCLSISL